MPNRMPRSPSHQKPAAQGDPDNVVFPQQFRPGFLWGVSTAAHQVEGSNHNNQWSDWEAAGRIRSGDRCGQACDWWNNAERDFDLAQEMGLNALRLSVEGAKSLLPCAWSTGSRHVMLALFMQFMNFSPAHR